ncbi:MAG: hypothetical protein EXR50_07335 [Dehalococcoidia bacterium]|nr:hypothetical protein [Dehalococcoidia bacterium]
MSGNRKGPGFLMGVVMGGLAAGAAGILIVSRASEETRRKWIEKGTGLMSSADTLASQAKVRMDGVVSQAKSSMADQSLTETLEDIREIIKEAAAEARELAQDALEQGKDASAKAKSDLQNHFEHSRSGDVPPKS